MKCLLHGFLVAELAIAIIFSGINVAQASPTKVKIETTHRTGSHIGRVRVNGGVVRLLVLKHCYEEVADAEEREIFQAAELAATKGLEIKDIGGFHIDRDGHAPRLVWSKKCTLSNLKAFISQQMKVAAVAGDTLLIYTTGHGSSDGDMDLLGQRKNIMKILAEAAEENNQETLWWQSSCYAAAGLPSISILNERQQELLSMIASSSADLVSYWGDQTEPMLRVFVAMAEKDPSLDANQDGEITSGELSAFLNKVKSGSGNLVFSKSPDEPIFGLIGPWSLPIIDRNNDQSMYKRGYIPTPLPI